MSSITPIASYRGSTSALDTRGWNLALAFQEVFTAIVRLRYNRQNVTNSEAFRAQMKQALLRAEQEGRSGGYKPEDVRQVLFAVVAFLDESVLGSKSPIFADWPRLPLQTELFGRQIAGEMVFSTASDLSRIAVINLILRNARSHLRDEDTNAPVRPDTRWAARTWQVDPFVKGPLGLLAHDCGARTQPRSPSSNLRPLPRPHSSNLCDHESARNSGQGFAAA